MLNNIPGMNDQHVAKNHVCLLLPGRLTENLQHVRINPIIGIGVDDELACGAIQTSLASSGNTLVVLMNSPEAGVSFCKVISNLPGLINTPVIHYNYFKVLERLLNETV